MEAWWHESQTPIHKDVGADEERQWLVQFCTRMTGTLDAAEDVAQETLFEAWRQADKLTEPAGRRAWLAAIARNVWLRWRRRHWRITSRVADVDLEEIGSDLLSVAGELESGELVTLMHQALERLDAATRQIVVQRYLNHSSYRAIADQIGVSEDAISMRLSRGRRQLQQILLRDFADAVSVYMSGIETDNLWETTRLWCRTCGQHRLLACLPHTSDTVAFRCPGCNPDAAGSGSEFRLTNHHFARLVGSLRRPTAILTRTTDWAYHYFQAALSTGVAPCTHCQRPVLLRVSFHDTHSPHFLYVNCDVCGTAVSSSLHGFLMQHPDVHRFWETESRIRLLPDEVVEVEGHPAVVTRFESLTSHTILALVSIRDGLHLPHGIQVMPVTKGA